MAKYLIFDTETDGLTTTGPDSGTANILEFAYILYDEDSGDISHGQMYFNTDHEIPYGASKVNGLTRSKLAHLSHGIYFDERIEDIQKVFHSADILVGHNSDSYDLPLMFSNFRKYGKSLSRTAEGVEKIWDTYDTMLHAKSVVPRRPNYGNSKRPYYGPKLVTAYAWVANNLYRKTASDLDKLFEQTFELTGTAHEAFYDVWMTFCVFKALKGLESRGG